MAALPLAEVAFHCCFYLIFLSALQELLQLGIQLRKAPRYPLYSGVQVSVLAVLCIEVILVTLTLL